MLTADVCNNIVEMAAKLGVKMSVGLLFVVGCYGRTDGENCMFILEEHLKTEKDMRLR